MSESLPDQTKRTATGAPTTGLEKPLDLGDLLDPSDRKPDQGNSTMGNPRMNAKEYRYQCAHDHEWVTVPVDKMRCPACGTVTLRRIKPAEGVEEAVAAALWAWNAEHSGGLRGYPYERLEEVTKDDLRALARRILPHVRRDADTFGESS